MLKLIPRVAPQYCMAGLTVQKQIHNIVTRPLKKEVQEIQIPVPWGHIAGKWWGPQNVKPILCVHGYQDNAGTWDTLAPLFPNDISLLAVDMPGHGLSSHFPTGTPYHFLDLVLTVRRISNHYGWDKISLLGHSYGSIQSFMYAALYPELVDYYIAIDAIKPLAVNPVEALEKHGEWIEKFLKIDSLDTGSTPTYSYDEAIDRLHKSINKWVSRKGCEILTRRGTTKQADGRYRYNRDPRLKVALDLRYTHDFVNQLAASVKCKVLDIEAKDGLKRWKPENKMGEFIEILKESATYYEYQVVEGAHHVHLDYPERIEPLILNFLKK